MANRSLPPECSAQGERVVKIRKAEVRKRSKNSVVFVIKKDDLDVAMPGEGMKVEIELVTPKGEIYPVEGSICSVSGDLVYVYVYVARHLPSTVRKWIEMRCLDFVRAHVVGKGPFIARRKPEF